MDKAPDAVGPKDTEKPSREQDERSREEHVAASGRQPDPPGGVVRLPNGGRCEMASELCGQWGQECRPAKLFPRTFCTFHASSRHLGARDGRLRQSDADADMLLPVYSCDRAVEFSRRFSVLASRAR